MLGDQIIFPAVAPILERGVDAVEADYPTPLLRLSAAELAGYQEEEADVLRRLGELARPGHGAPGDDEPPRSIF